MRALGHQHLVAGGTESLGTSVRRFSSPRPTFPLVLGGGNTATLLLVKAV